ncbi:hypothetical protein NZK32_06275 [Cyanobium sp. FGCU-52]|nr:hypothetical protein [Cyanobium sp. FGCU52]
MATLQIRDLSDPLHQLLQLRGRRQALAELQTMAEERGGRPFDPSPEELIRQDRSR